MSSSEVFKFKQFSIRQDQTAMKVGTDGVLLGAWANLTKAHNILDVGTGTGLIALMIAQRNHQAIIDAVEINQNATQQALQNFEASSWKDRINAFNVDFQHFKTNKKYDYIVSNPPFYQEDVRAGNHNRDMARHSKHLKVDLLVNKASKLMTAKGKIGLILPYTYKKQIQEIALENNLFIHRICYVKGNPQAKVKRILLEMGFEKQNLSEENLTIEMARHHYTPKYIQLTQEFYLKM